MTHSQPKAGCAALTETLVRGFFCGQVEKNRYLDVGDWNEGCVHAVRHPDPRSAAAVLVHEVIEKLLCDYYGITAEQVDRDDALILKGKKKVQQCSYYRHHRTATKVERIICKAFGLDWREHERNVDAAWEVQKELLGRRS